MNALGDEAVLVELGRRIASTRLEANRSQTHVAREAGVSVRTLARLEAGEPTSMVNFVRVLRALGLAGRLGELVPEPVPSPIERLKLEGRKRERAS